MPPESLHVARSIYRVFAESSAMRFAAMHCLRLAKVDIRSDCRCQPCLIKRESIGLPSCGVLWASDDRATHSALYRIKALFQHKALMDAAPTATSPRRRSTLLKVELALLRAVAEASARACARSESVAPEAVTSWAGSARKASLIRVSSLPGSP